MRLTRRRLNRTLLLRQHLLQRVTLPVEDLVAHLLGVQAQEPQGFYPNLAARLDGFDPYAVSAALEKRTLVRQVTLRGTVHLHTAADAVALREWTGPVAEKEIKVSQAIGAARDLDRSEFLDASTKALADGPLPQKHLGERLAAVFPEFRPSQLSQLARSAAALTQLPPRGQWQKSGGVVYDDLSRATGIPRSTPDAPDLIRRYLRAFGPAKAADVTAWSGVTGLAPIIKGMDDLIRYEDEDGKPIFDVSDGELAEEDQPAPVRLVGTYDNLWLAHAARDRVTEPEDRRRWMGVNGGAARVVLVDGWMGGLWRAEEGRAILVETFRSLSRSQQAELDDETDRMNDLLAS